MNDNNLKCKNSYCRDLVEPFCQGCFLKELKPLSLVKEFVARLKKNEIDEEMVNKVLSENK